MPKQYPKERVDEIAKLLDITHDEALEMLADDERIDKVEKLFELDPELEKGAKKARQVARSVSKTPTKRERKADADKGTLIQTLADSLDNLDIEDIEIINPEREFVFKLNGRKFKVVLSAPRS